MSLANKVARAQTRGDPGLFGDIWKGIKKVGGAVVGGVTGMVTGGPLGAVGGALRGAGIIRQPQILAPQQPRALPGLGMQQPGGWQMQIPPFTEYPLVRYTEPAGQVGVAPSGVPGGLPPRGYKLNKSGYFVHAGPRGSAAYGQGIWIPPRSTYVRARRRDPLNPRALDRATSRVTSFANADARSRRKVKKAAAKIK